MKSLLFLFFAFGVIKLSATNYQTYFTEMSSKSQYHIGMRYKYGDREHRDLRLSFKYLHKSALKGYVLAQYELALMFHYGEGVKQNSALAKMWFRRASKRGDRRSQLILERFYG